MLYLRILTQYAAPQKFFPEQGAPYKQKQAGMADSSLFGENSYYYILKTGITLRQRSSQQHH
jgi:hypothetical protein